MKRDSGKGSLLFSVVVVALNPGEKWRGTLQSIFAQKYNDFEIIYKDGRSRDGSWEALLAEYGADSRLRSFQEADKSIYDAMNQALDQVSGKYVLFLNCGDFFYDDRVLERTAEAIAKAGLPGETAVGAKAGVSGETAAGAKAVMSRETAAGAKAVVSGVTAAGAKAGLPGETAVDTKAVVSGEMAAQEKAEPSGEAGQECAGRLGRPTVFYGNTFSAATGAVVHSAPSITGFTCYRNIPCHQSCFYDARLFEAKRYDLQYRIRADYDHFLWCFYRGNARMAYMDFVVASYEGGGYSESRENQVRDSEEHRLITARYMSRGELLRYQAALALTLAPLRRFMAENKAFSGLYHRVKGWIYRRK